MTLVAFHGSADEKANIISVLAAHRAADSFVQGYGYWADGKGCAVGCTIQSGKHIEYEARFGIPVHLARLEDAIFEGLPTNLAKQWPERFMSAIAPGADLSLVHWKLLHWLLTTTSINPGIENPIVRDAVKQCAELIQILADGGIVAASAASAAWSAARSAERAARSAAVSAVSAVRSAESAAESAESAARSAASAAWSAAESAEKAARSAASAAWSAAESAAESAAWSAVSAARSAESAAWSAVSAARSAAWVNISDHLIGLIVSAPMFEPVSRQSRGQ